MLSYYRDSLQFIKSSIETFIFCLVENEIYFSVVLSETCMENLILILKEVDALIKYPT